jgi:hypothetical protein
LHGGTGGVEQDEDGVQHLIGEAADAALTIAATTVLAEGVWIRV